MRKIWGGALALAIALPMSAYIGAPYWTAYSLKQAVAEGDADKIEALTDIADVRSSLKSQISSAFLHKMGADPDLKGNPFVAIGAMIAPAIIDKAVDAYVTPEGLTSLMRGGKLGDSTPVQSRTNSPYIAENEYLGLDRFRVKLLKRDTREAGPSLLFERKGTFEWKLIRIELSSSLFLADSLSLSKGESGSSPDHNPILIDPVTQKLPRLGECFTTQIYQMGENSDPVAEALSKHPDTWSVVTYYDGHQMHDFGTGVQIQAWRESDPVRLCVTSVPTDCPAEDHRGVGYQATNIRTSSTWNGYDSEHHCGGA